MIVTACYRMMKWLVLVVMAATLGVASTTDDRIDDVRFDCLAYDTYSVDNGNCVVMC